MIKGMLNIYPNLYIDLSWVVYDDVICKIRKNNNQALHLKKSWMNEVILTYPDRIMIGSDLCGHFDAQGKTMARYNGLLETLPEREREMIAFKNAERLYFS